MGREEVRSRGNEVKSGRSQDIDFCPVYVPDIHSAGFPNEEQVRVRQPSAFLSRKQDVTNPVYSNTTANAIVQFRITTATSNVLVRTMRIQIPEKKTKQSCLISCRT